MGQTTIEWTQQTWNPVRGCSRISPGCVNCYAEKVAARFSDDGGPFHLFADRKKSGSKWTGKVELIPEMLDVPLRRRKPTTFFVNSMSDLFHESLSDEDIGKVFEYMCSAQQHTFQVLTKRAKRMRDFMLHYTSPGGPLAPGTVWCCRNIWLGVSVEDQQRADERIPVLLQTPAAMRFVSAEPLLGPIDLTRLRPEGCSGWIDAIGRREHRGPSVFEPETGLDWVIAGGESGPGARPCDVEWIRSIVQQCRAAGVACFVKQLGARPYPGSLGNGRMPEMALKDRKGGDMAEWPEDLRVRELPTSPSVEGRA